MDIEIKGINKKTMAGLEEIAERKGMTTEEFVRKYLQQIANDPISDNEDSFDIYMRICRITKENI